ncbi:MAG TPA: formate dehydrogenase accessory sulfurtransferase FdhD [Thermoanaerobaculia bacterium]|nr:formate dehydrogenase accessory sulfurtransferase FdhD [Thermoanaerobaculia bacterium]
MSHVDPIERVRVVAREGQGQVERDDALAVEEPLEIRIRPSEVVRGRPLVTTMRTPGHDEELTAGLLFAEGVVASRNDILGLDRPADPRIDPELRGNVMIATLAPDAHARGEKLERGTVMGSACGVCGKTSIENVIPPETPHLVSEIRIRPEVLFALPGRLREGQSVFSRTGGLHAAGLFDAEGHIRVLHEDIGRHNATDKVVGHILLEDGLPLTESVLMVSGRAGFEIVQKAYFAGIPIVASVSAPSSLAVELADAAGLTLVGFLRERRYNVYSHPARILTA